MGADDMYDQAAQQFFDQTREIDFVSLRLKPMTGGDRDYVMRLAGKLRQEHDSLMNPGEEERCERFELPRSGCDHCRRADARLSPEGRVAQEIATYWTATDVEGDVLGD
jgi:hypothetical protein